MIAPIGSVIGLRDSNIVLKRIRFEARYRRADRFVLACHSLYLVRSWVSLHLFSSFSFFFLSFFKFNRASFLTKRSVATMCFHSVLVYIYIYISSVRDEVDLRGFERIERNVVSESWKGFVYGVAILNENSFDQKKFIKEFSYMIFIRSNLTYRIDILLILIFYPERISFIIFLN